MAKNKQQNRAQAQPSNAQFEQEIASEELLQGEAAANQQQRQAAKDARAANNQAQNNNK